MKKYKILNCYACLGGNRAKWDEVAEIEVTAIELDPKLARMYKERFLNDTVIVADAHQYILDHYKEFDFIWSSPPCPSHSRVRFTQKNKEFYDNLLQAEVLQKLPPAKKCLLYAPTWQDGEQSSSFYEATPHLIKNLPKDWNLIIKPHPNLALKEQATYDSFLQLAQTHPNIIFITDFPLIYPLLSAVDMYIGDFSSIGYDFLTFQKPMFFLNQQQRVRESDLGLYLYQCGTEIKPHDYPNIYTIIQNALPQDHALFSSSRKEVYEYTFAEEIEPATLRDKIFSSYTHFS